MCGRKCGDNLDTANVIHGTSNEEDLLDVRFSGFNSYSPTQETLTVVFPILVPAAHVSPGNTLPQWELKDKTA